MKKIIVTGDDFGLAKPINEAIIEAHQRGILTAASLMVGTEFSQDAIQRALRLTSLKIGLHLVLVEGRSILAPRDIPDLVDAEGEFSSQLTRSGFKYFFYHGIRRQLEAEIRAQFEAFSKTGLRLDHVNAHNHLHLHPTIMRLILKVGKEYGLRAVRLPHEPPLRSWKASRKSFGSKVATWFLLRPWIALMKRMLRQSHISHNDFLFGMADSGAMSQDLVLRFLRNLPDGVTEIYFHPATCRCKEIDRTMPLYRHEDEFRVLTSNLVSRAVQEAGVQRIAFSDI